MGRIILVVRQRATENEVFSFLFALFGEPLFRP